MRTWVLWVLSATAAHAGVPVALPASEPADRWQNAFEVAGLEVAVDAVRADVRIEAGEGYWRLVALQDGEARRTVTVQAPTHGDERLEVAFLARALARSLEPAAVPDPMLEPPPAPEWFDPVPPPPAPVLTEPPPEPVVPPDPDPGAPEPGAPEPGTPEPGTPEPGTPDSGIPDPEAPDSGIPDPEEPDPEEPEFEPSEPDAQEPEEPRVPTRWERLDLRYPPIALAVGGAWRGPATSIAADFGLQVGVGRIGPFLCAVEGGASTERRTFLIDGGDVFRTYNDLRVGAAVGWEPTRVKPELLGGVGRRAFSQQGQRVKEMIAPYLGAGVEVSAGGAFAPGLRARALVDLRGMDLVDETGQRDAMPRLDVSVAFVVRIRPPSDPFRPAPTPTER